MRCPHCEEYDIPDTEIIEVAYTYTTQEETKLKELEEELHSCYNIIGEQGTENSKLKAEIQLLEQELSAWRADA